MVDIPTMFHEVWWKKSKILKNPPFFYFNGNCGKVCPTDSDFFLVYLVPLNVDVTRNITAKICEVWSEFNIFLHLGYHGNGHQFEFFQPPPPKAATHYGGYSYKVSWSLMKGIQKCFKSPFFVSMVTAAKFVQTIPIFVRLSRSTRSGCCSCQVSSISVWRVTCYDHFCVFQFFCILAVSMATAPIFKKSTLNSTALHGIRYSYKVA
jgi:hypothetical protein